MQIPMKLIRKHFPKISLKRPSKVFEASTKPKKNLDLAMLCLWIPGTLVMLIHKKMCQKDCD